MYVVLKPHYLPAPLSHKWPNNVFDTSLTPLAFINLLEPGNTRHWKNKIHGCLCSHDNQCWVPFGPRTVLLSKKGIWWTWLGIVSRLSHLNAATLEGGFELKSSCCGWWRRKGDLGMERYFNDEILLALSSNTLHTIFQILCWWNTSKLLLSFLLDKEICSHKDQRWKNYFKYYSSSTFFESLNKGAKWRCGWVSNRL